MHWSIAALVFGVQPRARPDNGVRLTVEYSEFHSTVRGTGNGVVGAISRRSTEVMPTHTCGKVENKCEIVGGHTHDTRATRSLTLVIAVFRPGLAGACANQTSISAIPAVLTLVITECVGREALTP